MSNENSAANLPSIDDVVATLKGGSTSDPAIPAQGEAAAAPEVTKEPAPEPSKEPVEAAKDKKDEPAPSASRFAALARREKETRQREQDATRRIKEAEERERLSTERVTTHEQAMSRLKQDPIGALKAAGLSMQDVVNAAYGNYKAPEEDPVDAKLKPIAAKFDKFESENAELRAEIRKLVDQQNQKEQQSQYNQVISGIKATMADVDKYELLNAVGAEAIDLVKDIMVEYWNRNERLLSEAEACDIAEKYYETDVLGKLAATKKATSRFTTSAPAPAKPAPQPKEAKSPSTLTNKLQTTSQSNVDIDKLSREDALAYLTKKLQYK